MYSWQILVAQRIVVRAPVEPVGDAALRAAGDRNHGRRRIRRAKRPALACGRSERQQVGELAAVERQILDFLRSGDLADTGVLDLHHRGSRLDGNFLRDGADLQRDVDRGIDADLKDDAVLHVLAEALLGHGELIRAHRQLRQVVVALCAAGSGAHGSRGRLRERDLRAWYGRTAGVHDRAANLRRGDGLRREDRADTQNQKAGPEDELGSHDSPQRDRFLYRVRPGLSRDPIADRTSWCQSACLINCVVRRFEPRLPRYFLRLTRLRRPSSVRM